MNEQDLRALIAAVAAGRLSRRNFVRQLAGVGLAAPLAGMMLANAGLAQPPAEGEYKPTKAGGGGTLKVLWWQSPTLLNPHFAVGTKDQDGSRIFYEPLAAWDPDGNLVPVLAADIPSAENGGLDKTLTWVVWKLKPGVKWHDGTPFTADDCVFNWQYAADPATAATTIASYQNITVAKLDDHTIKIQFKTPTPFWPDAFVGLRGMIIPKHLFEKYTGASSREAPANLQPVGTGPYMFVDFKPGDLVRGKRNPDYHEPNRPYFDQIEMKGGGDAVSAARAVLQTGEYDYGWNIQVDWPLLQRLEAGGKGRVDVTPSGNIEHIELNNTDPSKEVDGQRSSVDTSHPFLTDPNVRQAFNLLVDRKSVHEFIYGSSGDDTGNFINNPERFVSKNTHYEFNVEKAVAILDEAGWKPGADGIREKNGIKLRVTYQTSINAPRQKTQEIVKQACQKAGIGVDIKAVPASVYFSSDVGNPDTYAKFYTDIQMFTTGMSAPDPSDFMRQFASWEIAQKANKWQGRNITRWRNDKYDALFKAAGQEIDPVKRAAMFIAMNDLVIKDVVVIPVVTRPKVVTMAKGLHATNSGWDSDLWDLKNWYKDA
jgi:peptide/nickel transport system substrate-binding protein